MLYCWTASHINVHARLVWLLQDLIPSIQCASEVARHYISISFLNENWQKEFTQAIQYYKNITVIYQNSQLSQFDHLDRIFKAYQFNEDDKILFMDDDDILVYIPREYATYDVLLGVQELMPTVPGDRSLVITDFSGFTAKYELVMHYFRDRDSTQYGCLEDCRFTRCVQASTASVFRDDVFFVKRRTHSVSCWTDEIVQSLLERL